MPRDDMTVTALRFGDSDDPLWRSIATDVDATAILPASLETARQRIAALALDALVYTDIGMEPLTYFLAFARLAPLQCVLGGHPDTVGIPAIDLFLSSDLQEPPDAAEHYSERLVRLPGAPTYYERPSLPSPLKPRSAFGLSDGQPLYFCAQTLIKIHPEMDILFAAILDRDPDGVLVLPGGYNPRLADHLRARFVESLGPRASRVTVLPALSHFDFMNVMAFADVSLDTRPFGGGNTSWQAIAAGTPVVTWPGRFLRGRYTQALYRLAGATDTVVDSAQAYVEMAVRLARDRAFRAAVQARVEAGAGRIFADRTHVEGLAAALRHFVGA
jgi:predicted O-linked N-acetylglucosamine transferase (SPINDLY family)